ncbi:MAG: hypothetical protein R3C59_18755 [Planctomycetaceae bacterium]
MILTFVLNNQPHRESEKSTELNGSVNGTPSTERSLAEILELVVNASRTDADLSPADSELKSRLSTVVAQFPGQPLTFDPGLLAIVRVITEQFRLLTAAQHSQLTAAVARTLYDDSSSRNRLERLWNVLQEARP